MSNITILTNTTAVDLITFPHHSRNPLEAYNPVVAHGAYAFDREERTVHRYMSAATILATGGLGRIFQNTTNPTWLARRWAGHGPPRRGAHRQC